MKALEEQVHELHARVEKLEADVVRLTDENIKLATSLERSVDTNKIAFESMARGMLSLSDRINNLLGEITGNLP